MTLIYYNALFSLELCSEKAHFFNGSCYQHMGDAMYTNSEAKQKCIDSNAGSIMALESEIEDSYIKYRLGGNNQTVWNNFENLGNGWSFPGSNSQYRNWLQDEPKAGNNASVIVYEKDGVNPMVYGWRSVVMGSSFKAQLICEQMNVV